MYVYEKGGSNLRLRPTCWSALTAWSTIEAPRLFPCVYCEGIKAAVTPGLSALNGARAALCGHCGCAARVSCKGLRELINFIAYNLIFTQC